MGFHVEVDESNRFTVELTRERVIDLVSDDPEFEGDASARSDAELVDAFLAIDWVQVGIDMMNAIWTGMKSIAGSMGAWMKAQATSWMPDWLKGAAGSAPIGGGSH